MCLKRFSFVITLLALIVSCGRDQKAIEAPVNPPAFPQPVRQPTELPVVETEEEPPSNMLDERTYQWLRNYYYQQLMATIHSMRPLYFEPWEQPEPEPDSSPAPPTVQRVQQFNFIPSKDVPISCAARSSRGWRSLGISKTISVGSSISIHAQGQFALLPPRSFMGLRLVVESLGGGTSSSTSPSSSSSSSSPASGTVLKKEIVHTMGTTGMTNLSQHFSRTFYIQNAGSQIKVSAEIMVYTPDDNACHLDKVRTRTGKLRAIQLTVVNLE